METLAATKTETVKDIYSAFVHGDVQFVISHLDENVNWHVIGAPGIQYGGVYKGKIEMPLFFQKMGSKMR
jgi:ketosteroid isomerase-like protein